MSRLTRIGDDLEVQKPRVVVPDLDPDAHPDAALRAAREASAQGHEVVYLGTSDAASTAWAARAEDAGRVLVVGDDAAGRRLRAALADVGLDDVEVSLLPSS